MKNLPTTPAAPERLLPADGERRCILVLGMHRSGTSVVTRIINLLGADLPQSLMRPGRDNPRGYWESRDLLQLHEQLLASGGSRWDDWQPFPRPNGTIDRQEAIQSQLVSVLTREFAASRLFAVKDPRMCRFVPVWLEVLQRLRTPPLAVLPVRHPFEVARSLEERNGIPFHEGCLLWLRHVIEAERTTRQIPRVFVNYESLLENWFPEVDRVAEALRVPRPSASDEAAVAMTEFLSPRLRHHAFSLDELDTRTDVVDWIPRGYHALRSLTANGEDEAARRELDQIRGEFDRACLAFGGLLRVEREQVPRQPEATNVRPRVPRAKHPTRLSAALSLLLSPAFAVLGYGRRIERSFRRWRRRESSRNTIP